jgi:DNA-binding IclR family transcriptional regulator
MENGLDGNSVFVEVFGNNPVIKVLDFLITFQAFDYPLTEIARNSGVSYSTLQIFWGKLVKNRLVIKTRRVGKSDLFKLNTKNPAVQQLIKLDWNLVKGSEKEIEEVVA